MTLKTGLLSFLLVFLPLQAGSPFEATRTALQTVSVEEGLPNARVHCLLRDHLGRLWAGTQEGVSFLGSSGWTTLALPREAPSTYIRALAETPDGALWFGTDAGGLWRRQRGLWRHWTERELGSSRINALHVEGATLWIGTARGGLFSLQGDRLLAEQGLPETAIWSIATVPDASGRPQLWVGGEQQIWARQPSGWRELGLRAGWKGGANAIVPRRSPSGLLEVWVSSWGNGVGVWDPRRQKFLSATPPLPSPNPTCMAATRSAGAEEELWVGTYDQGLFKLTASGWESLDTAKDFPSNSIYCILPSPEGRPSFWVGTRGAGLVAVDPAGWRSLPEHPAIPSRQANCFLETRDAAGAWIFWMGTDKGLVRWDAHGPTLETSAHGLPGEFITDLMELHTPEGPELWASTIGGLARRKNGRWQAFGRKQGLEFYRMHGLAGDLDGQGRARVFGAGDGGLAVGEHGAWSLLTTGQGLPHNHVTSLLTTREPDGHSALWVGTRGGGLGRLKEGRWQVFGTAHGLLNNSVYGLAATVAPNGRRLLWVAVLGEGGLARLDLDHPEQGFRTWNQSQLPGLNGRGIQGLLAHRNDTLYLTTTSGVARLELSGPDAEPGQLVAFMASDGLPSSVATGSRALFVDHSGRVWAGTTKGVAVLAPGAEHGWPPPPMVERVTIQGREVDPEGPIRMGFGDRRLRVAFALPIFHRHEAILYQTQLLGFDAQPQEWTKRPEIEFTTLAPRKYILRIWAKDGLGRQASYRDLPITVLPPPWFTWWALLLEAALLTGLVYLLVYRRQRNLARRTHDLERVVQERTQELANANEALHARSLTDPLTGLDNRRGMDEAMGGIMSAYLRHHAASPSLAPDSNLEVGFLVLDLDHFKAVNDTHGHRAGDLVLQQTAELLRRTVRDTDRVVRWGGEEFVIVAVETQLSEVPPLAERLRTAIGTHSFDIGQGAPLHLTVSVGFACLPLHPSATGQAKWEHTLNLADECLYQAKLAGRNRWVGLLPLPQRDTALEADLSGMMAEDLVARGWVERRNGP